MCHPNVLAMNLSCSLLPCSFTIDADLPVSRSLSHLSICVVCLISQQLISSSQTELCSPRKVMLVFPNDRSHFQIFFSIISVVSDVLLIDLQQCFFSQTNKQMYVLDISVYDQQLTNSALTMKISYFSCMKEVVLKIFFYVT